MAVDTSIKVHRRISTLLLAILSSIAALVLIGLTVMTLRLIEIQNDLGALRDNALPRLAKLSQLSQEAVSTISIAPALSAEPTRFEFETLISRIKDKEVSQRALIEELNRLILDENAAATLRRNGDQLMENLDTMTDVVSQQIIVRKRLEDNVEHLRSLANRLTPLGRSPEMDSSPANQPHEDRHSRVHDLASSFISKVLSTLFDPIGARFARNREELEDGFQRLASLADEAAAAVPGSTGKELEAVSQLLDLWPAEKAQIYQDKQLELSNDFKIKALAEENALIANRLLSSANAEFWQASTELQSQIASVDRTARFTLVTMLIVLVGFGAGNFFVWLVLHKRVFQRLDRIRGALQIFAENRERPKVDRVADEIGAISRSLVHYMGVIDQREAELAEKSQALEQLSIQLAKYLSPQIYDSIFSGRQEVKVASSRKKLTIFFSDIVGFTETADRLESEELSQLLNHYLTEMSQIALDHGATIDKYVGDAILVFFGDPESRGARQDALSCVRMALAMRRKMHELADIWRQTGIEKPLRVRMGIHTGYCTVGNFGSENRLDYTIVGGAVNTASRLEEQARPGEILISYETFALVQEEIACEEFGEFEVKGIAYPVATYRVVDSYDQLERERQHFSEVHPKLKLDLDLASMTSSERNEAADILRRALDMVEEKHEERHPAARQGS